MLHRTQKSGFALLLVLLVIALAGTAMAALARRQGLLAVQAVRAQRDAQLRWGMLSCRNLLLSQAEQILQAAQQKEQLPQPEASFGVDLGAVRFEMVVADEQAKANVNLLAQRLSQRDLQHRLEELVAKEANALTVRLIPLKYPEKAQQVSQGELPGDDMVLYESLDQVFQYDSVSSLFGPSAGRGSQARRRVTCWGDGKINIHRAEIEVLRAMLGDTLDESDIQALIHDRAGQSSWNLIRAIAELELSEEQLVKVKQILTTESHCYSLWICARDGFRQHYSLRILYTEDKDAYHKLFVWTES